MRILVVKSDFGDWRRGDEIADPQAVEAILAGEQSQHVTVTEREEPAAPPAEPAPSDKPKKSSK
jgi:hypothetical protein